MAREMAFMFFVSISIYRFLSRLCALYFQSSASLTHPHSRQHGLAPSQDLVHVGSLIAFHLVCSARNLTPINPRNSSNFLDKVSALVMGIVLSKFLQ
jgi:hypothetical protein